MELRMDSRETMLEELCNGYRIFAAHGWGDLGDGHISARDPDRTDCFWLLGYGVAFAEAEPSDFVLLNAKGLVVEGSGDVNKAGFFIHQRAITQCSGHGRLRNTGHMCNIKRRGFFFHAWKT